MSKRKKLLTQSFTKQQKTSIPSNPELPGPTFPPPPPLPLSRYEQEILNLLRTGVNAIVAIAVRSSHPLARKVDPQNDASPVVEPNPDLNQYGPGKPQSLTSPTSSEPVKTEREVLYEGIEKTQEDMEKTQEQERKVPRRVPVLDLAAVQQAVLEYAGVFGPKATLEVLKKLGVERARDLTPDKYAKAIEALALEVLRG